MTASILDPSPPEVPSRRRFLELGGGAVVATVLAPCSSDAKTVTRRTRGAGTTFLRGTQTARPDGIVELTHRTRPNPKEILWWT